MRPAEQEDVALKALAVASDCMALLSAAEHGQRLPISIRRAILADVKALRAVAPRLVDDARRAAA